METGRLKILQVGSSMPDDWGGIERYLSYLSPGLAEAGHDVSTTCVPGSPLDTHLDGKKFPLRLRRKYDFMALSKYLSLFKKVKYDLVVTHYSPDYLMPAWAARMRNQRRVVMTRHVAVKFESYRAASYAKHYDGFIGVSSAVSRVLADSGLPQGKIHTVLGGCPPLSTTLTKEEARAKYVINGFAIGIFGRFVPEKGHLYGIEAVKHAEVDGAVVHMFGRGSYIDEIKTACVDVWGLPWFTQAEGATSGVVNHGYVADVADAMKAMDVILVPSVWEEAFGFVVTEAMSLGIPVVAFGVGGLCEIVTHGSDGFLVPPKDTWAMGDAIRRLAHDPDLRMQIGEAGRAKHSSMFRVEDLVSRTEKVYRAIVDQS